MRSNVPFRAATAAVLALAVLVATPARAQATEPGGPHPRLFLDDATTQALQALAKQRGSVVHGVVRACDRIVASPAEYARDGYMGLDWARSLQTCLVAWKASGKPGHAVAAVRYFTALIDDRQQIGDGKGGDSAATRDSGYAIRAHGPYTALAYDWLYSHPEMSETVKARARRRFKAWTDWYLKEGYRARSPGTNYHAGYVFAATLIAVAQAGDAGPDGEQLWRHVKDTIFGKDLLPAAKDGVLVGGDWGEGWQYAPLSLAEYSLSARAVAPYGVDVAPIGDWLRDVLLRHVYALTPAGDRTFVVGDTQSATANLSVRRETLEAVLIGPAPADAKAWAQSELDRIATFPGDLGYVLFTALGEAAQVQARPFPRDSAPTAYLSEGTSIAYTRTSWKPSAVWFVTACSSTIDVDHLPAHAGNFVLSRGASNLIVDPSPYGSLSSLTSNAPTIESTVLPENYIPSQAYWSRKTGFRWLATTSDGVLVARCDYADQYRIQDTPSDIPLAYRDFVLLPYADEGGGESAALLVLDRARGKQDKQKLHLRFRSQAPLAADGTGAGGKRGKSSLTIRQLAASGGTPEVRELDAGSCFDEKKKYTRGGCDAARFDVSELRLVVPGPGPSAIHLIDAAPAAKAPAPATALTATGGKAWEIVRGKQRWVIAVQDADAALGYDSAPGATHVVLPAAVRGASGMKVGASLQGEACRIAVGATDGTAVGGAPGLFATSADCRVSALPATPVPAGGDVLKPARAAASGTAVAPAAQAGSARSGR